MKIVANVEGSAADVADEALTWAELLLQTGPRHQLRFAQRDAVDPLPEPYVQIEGER
jgi:hypothetical protein